MAVLPLLATDKIKSSVKDAYGGPLMRGAISYLDFYLLLSRTERGYRAQVLSSPAGEASSDFVAPFSDLELDNFVLRIGRPRRSTRRTGSPEMEAIKMAKVFTRPSSLAMSKLAGAPASPKPRRKTPAASAIAHCRSARAQRCPLGISLQRIPQPLPVSIGIYPAHPVSRPP